MTLKQIYKKFPTKESCLKVLEELFWNNSPTCPYCTSSNFTIVPKENRYRCNNCNTTYSVTVKTIFHKTKCDLQKWFYAIPVTLDITKQQSVRQLGEHIGVTKDTALFMMNRIERDRPHLEKLASLIINTFSNAKKD
jgi:transposase-like protein